MDAVPVTIDMTVKIQCGKSLLVPINGLNVLITASTDTSEPGDGGAKGSTSGGEAPTGPWEGPSKPPEMEGPPRWEDPSIATVKREDSTSSGRDEVPVLYMEKLWEITGIRGADRQPEKQSLSGTGKSHFFQIKDVAGVHMPYVSVDLDDLSSLKDFGGGPGGKLD